MGRNSMRAMIVGHRSASLWEAAWLSKGRWEFGSIHFSSIGKMERGKRPDADYHGSNHRWDMGLLDMCPGDKRTLTIPPEFGYGDRGMGPIPAGSTLSTYCFSIIPEHMSRNIFLVTNRAQYASD